MDRLSGKVALITGAARGMGHATAELFAAEGAKVVASDIAAADPGYTSDAIEAAHLDVTEEEDWARVVAGIADRHGRLDILVNNAGIIAYEPIEELTLAAWNRMIAVDQTGVFLGMRAVIPLMKASGGGAIVNISSIWGNVGVAGAHAYQAAKGAVRNMTKNVALTHVADGIRVNSIHPGYIDTPLTQVQPKEVNDMMIETTPMRRCGQPIEVAYGSLYLASDEASFVTGACIDSNGGAFMA